MGSQLQPGDVVHLNSGGPGMTVVTVDPDGSITCQWFDGKKLCVEDFPRASLTKPDLSRPLLRR